MDLLKTLVTTELCTLDSSATILDALDLMKQNHHGCIAIVEKDIPIAILTERDIVLKLTTNLDLKDRASSIAETELITAQENQAIDYALEIFQNNEIRRIVLVDNAGKYVGLVFKEDVFDYLKEDLFNHIKEKQKLQQILDKEIKKRIDSQYLLIQQSKLASMGEMISFIAHQWRQPLGQLGGIFMNIESATWVNELTEDYLNEKLRHGNKLITYMSDTIEDFRHFFLPTKKHEIFSLNEYIKNAINIIQASLTYNHINVEFDSEDIMIEGYPSELSQVILALLSNAQEAILDNNSPAPLIEIKTKKIYDILYITIEDNGGGIEESLMDKIFDIHFSTRTDEDRCGLGLYIAKLIIETKFEGKIYCENGKKGAIFTIELYL